MCETDHHFRHSTKWSPSFPGVFSSLRRIAFFLLVPFAVPAQTLVLNNTLLDSGIHRAVKTYTSAIAGSARLYTGSQYRELELHEYDTGHPYFASGEWSVGAVLYDHEFYSNVYLLYDISLEKVVVEHPYDYSKIELIREKLESFTIADHRFVKLSGDSSSKSSLRAGYYEMLYDGRTKVYAKRSKLIVLKIEEGVEKKKFKDQNRYFIEKQGTFFPVKSKSSVWQVLSERKAQVRKEMAKNKISFKANLEFALSEIARYYDESEVTP